MEIKKIDYAHEIIREMERAKEFPDLMKGLEKISNLVNDPNLIATSENKTELEHLYALTAKAYGLANEITQKKFSDKIAISKNFKSNQQYWNSKSYSNSNDIAKEYFDQGYKLFNDQKYHESNKCFDMGLKLDPVNFQGLIGKGNSLFNRKKFDLAIQYYDEVLKKEKQNSIANFNKGLAFYNLGKYKEANTYFDLSNINGNNSSETFFVSKGYSFLKLENYKESEEYFKKALGLNSHSVEALTGLSSVYHRGFFDHKKAAECAKQILKIDKTRIDAKANLAEFLLDSNCYRQREKIADEVISEKPNTYGYPMRIVKICSLFFREMEDDSIRASIDLLEFYKEVNDKIKLDWDFRGLQHIIMDKRKDKKLIGKILFDFIHLAKIVNVTEKEKILQSIEKKLYKKKIFQELQNLQKEIKIKSISEPKESQPGWYYWEIFLEKNNTFTKIHDVTYFLHPTFQDNKRTIDYSESGFLLKSMGWGEFLVKVRINFKNGSTIFKENKKIFKYFWLTLGYTPLDDTTD